MLVAFCNCCFNMALMPVLKFNMIRKLNCITTGLYPLSILIWLKCFSSVAFHNRFIAKPGSKATSTLVCPRLKEMPNGFLSCKFNLLPYKAGSKLQTQIHLALVELLAEKGLVELVRGPGSLWGLLRFNTHLLWGQKTRRFGSCCLVLRLLSNAVTTGS